ncbi:hypothetical protein KC19_9G094700 [Ceratodon purpureus]|uniref:Secreted protein n=1 Tax=Ceratodon purpureus TaxID=3225 RepID=A0A8T0GTD9_CERPU|nr:hypothetical protein KC19_9G094700 [Ceratodon purpureus]
MGLNAVLAILCNWLRGGGGRKSSNLVPLYLHNPLLLAAYRASKPSISACVIPNTRYRTLRRIASTNELPTYT